MRVYVALLGALLVVPAIRADEPSTAAPTHVPFRITDTHHVMVRLKINDKGPFNFIIDTGCPVLLIATPVGKKAGLATDARGWTKIPKLEIEGGVELKDVKALVETPFQIEGMNSMGAAGIELHGMLGYTVLAKFRTELDFQDAKMTWTPLAFDPPEPKKLEMKGGSTGMEVMSGMMRFLGMLVNLKTPAPQPRGFFGFELSETDEAVAVARVLPGSPAASAGLKTGDRILTAEAKEIRKRADVLEAARRIAVGGELRLQVERDGPRTGVRETREISIKSSQGL